LTLLEEIVSSFKQSVVFLFGPPGCGKSTFWNTHMSGYLRINHDTIKTVDKGLKLIDAELIKPQPRGIVIDNTNCLKRQRADYLKKAAENKYRPIAFIFNIDKEITMFMDKAR
jgi:predicted kinase